MELKRKIYQKLLRWKSESNGAKALLIEGARRVGKSTIAEKFGKEQYRSCILVDFARASAKVKENFENLNRLDIFFRTFPLSATPVFTRGRLSLSLTKSRNFPEPERLSNTW